MEDDLDLDYELECHWVDDLEIRVVRFHVALNRDDLEVVDQIHEDLVDQNHVVLDHEIQDLDAHDLDSVHGISGFSSFDLAMVLVAFRDDVAQHQVAVFY